MVFIPPPPITGKVIFLGDYAGKYPKVRDILYYHGTGEVRRDKVYLSAYNVIRNTFHQLKKDKQLRNRNKTFTPPKKNGGK